LTFAFGLDAINVNCEFYVTGRETFGPLKSPYQCAAKDQKVSGYGSVDNVLGTHVANKGNSDVKLISLKKIKTERIPKNIHKFFPDLEGIFAFSMGLKTVVKDDLKDFPKLKYIDMGFNRLDTLPSNLFENNPELEWIDFSDNILRNIGVQLLDSLTKLNFANFESNRCVDRRAQDKTNLHELELVLKSLPCRLDDV
jgi:hypothetical protein